MRNLILIILLFMVHAFINAQEAQFNPSGDSFIGNMSAKESSVNGNVFLMLNRSDDDDQSLISYNLNALGSPSNIENSWRAGLDQDSLFSISRYTRTLFPNFSSSTFPALTISDDADGNGTIGDLRVKLEGETELQIGLIGGIFHGGLNSTQFEGDSFHPLSNNATSLGISTNRWKDVWAVDGTINTSDGRLKKNIKKSHYGLSQLMKLNPVTYNWKSLDDQSNQLGLIAQEVLKVIPEAVVTSERRMNEKGDIEVVPVETLGMKYSVLIPVLISSIQEQQSTIIALSLRIEELEK